jgi:hypothetical protein
MEGLSRGYERWSGIEKSCRPDTGIADIRPLGCVRILLSCRRNASERDEAR